MADLTPSEIHVVNLEGDRLDFQTTVDVTCPDRPTDVATVISIAHDGRHMFLALTSQQRVALSDALGSPAADRSVQALEILLEATLPNPPVDAAVSIQAAIDVLEGRGIR